MKQCMLHKALILFRMKYCEDDGGELLWRVYFLSDIVSKAFHIFTWGRPGREHIHWHVHGTQKQSVCSFLLSLAAVFLVVKR